MNVHLMGKVLYYLPIESYNHIFQELLDRGQAASSVSDFSLDKFVMQENNRTYLNILLAVKSHLRLVQTSCKSAATSNCRSPLQ